jgi:DNA-binding NarL/FixJ family response regulator
VTLTRVPFYRGHVWKHAYDEDRHPELEPPPRKSVRLPEPLVDPCCWYKYSLAGHYLGSDPSNWRKDFDDEGMRPRRDLPKRKRYDKPRQSQSRGSEHFNGWFWLCPVCQARCRKVYYPLPVVSLINENVPKIARLVEIRRQVNGFACAKCHGVRWHTSLGSDAWNQLIAYLTQGLLYGSDVEKPSWWTPTRKREYRPRPSREAPRRAMVLRRLLNGWTLEQIAAEMKIKKPMVYEHMLNICRAEGVKDRHELVAKLGSKHAQPLNTWDRAKQVRAEVEKLIRAGLSNAQIAERLRIKERLVADHAWKIFRSHGVVGRRGLMAKVAEHRNSN